MCDISILTSRTISAAHLDGARVVADLQWLMDACNERMMTDTVKWVTELFEYLPSEWITNFEDLDVPCSSSMSSRVSLENREILLARSLFLTKEFARASFFLSRVKGKNSVNKFLYYWSRYLMCYKYNAENEADAMDHKTSDRSMKDDDDMVELHQDMLADYGNNPGSFDAFLLFLLAKVEHAMEDGNKAFETMKQAIEKEPRLWAAWEAIVDIVPSPDDVHSVVLLEKPGYASWMADWFSCLALRHFNYDRSSTEKVEQLLARGFPEVPMILAHKAAAADNMLEHVQAIELFGKLRAKDPLRIEEMHLYCDSLFCMGERTELTSLTHSFFRTHKFHWETCYIVGNYYTIRGEHEQAVRFFQRALRLNPKMASIWVVVGHEFVELKNNSAACLAYRRAIEINPHEYRAWYGLGQLYDILKMQAHALHYYQKAHMCSPHDSRILVALGLIYNKMGRTRDAQKCFTVAYKNGDVEGSALWHLAKIFENNQQMDNAARTYETYLRGQDEMEVVNENVVHILQFLAKHYASKDDWEKATQYAQRCIEHESIAEDGKTILRDASQKKDADAVLNESLADNMQVSEGEDEISFD